MRLNSLSLRLFAATALVVVLTLALGAHFSGRAVQDNFSEYSRQEAEEQAFGIAVYLEAWLNSSGLTGDPGLALKRLFGGEIESFETPPNEQATLNYETDWTLWEQLVERNPNMEENQLLAAIMSLEVERLQQDGRFKGFDLIDILATTLDEAYTFVYWDDDEDDEAYQGNLNDRISWFLDTMVEDSHILAIDPEGLIIFDSTDAKLGSLISDALWETSTEIHDWQNDGRVLCEIVVASGEGYYRHQASVFLARVRTALFQGALVTLAIALLLALWFARRVLAPVRALTAASQSLARGERSEQLPVTSRDEVGSMSQSFNNMLDAIESQQEKRRQMVADLAHELNTPLSVIRLELAGLEAGMQETGDCVQHIEAELQVLSRLAADVALLAGADRGELALNLATTDIPACCADAVARWQVRATAAEISLSYVGPSQLPEVQADELRISQVLGNLISNAIRHTPAGGTIRVDAQASSAAAMKHPSQKTLIVSVRDNGEGIAAEELGMIFERFTRLDSARSRQSGGSGLGLAIVADIISRHGGEVWAESSFGEGCTIRFSLPR